MFNNSLGFAEIRIRDDAADAADVRVDEVVRMPVDLLETVGDASAERRLVYVMTRSRTRLTKPRLGQDEPILVRELLVLTDRSFGVGGQARLAQDAPDEIVDAVVGLEPGGVSVRSSARLPGSVRSRGSSAFDGDDTTAWTTPFGDADRQLGRDRPARRGDDRPHRRARHRGRRSSLGPHPGPDRRWRRVAHHRSAGRSRRTSRRTLSRCRSRSRH